MWQPEAGKHKMLGGVAFPWGPHPSPASLRPVLSAQIERCFASVPIVPTRLCVIWLKWGELERRIYGTLCLHPYPITETLAAQHILQNEMENRGLRYIKRVLEATRCLIRIIAWEERGFLSLPARS